MVRPVARFRPAARRATDGQLVPVFFTRPTGTPGPLTVRSGSEPGGVVKELNIYDDAPRTLAPTASKGLLDTVKRAVGVPGADTVIYAESETITTEQDFRILRQDVINGVAYVFCFRTHLARHSASLTYQLFDYQGANGTEYGSISPVITETAEAVCDAIYDVAVFAVNLDSGSLSTSSKTVYQLEGTPTNFVFLSYIASTDATEYRYPVALAFSEILPAEHPFKTCGALAWGSDSVAVFQGRPPSVDSANTLFDLTPRGYGTFTNQMSRNYSALFGLDTTNAQRVIQSGRVIELSGYQSASNTTCELYQSIGVLWVDSFVDYNPSELIEREDIFADLSGLSESDLAFFLQAYQSPPLAIQAGASPAGVTLDPRYFLDGSALGIGSLSFAQNRQMQLRYWITD